MKATPKKFYEVNAKLVHCGPADGNDFTLCGFTLDGDQGEIIEWKGSRIDCPQCLAIIHFCRSIPVTRWLRRIDHEAAVLPVG